MRKMIKMPNERYWKVPTKTVSVKVPVNSAEIILKMFHELLQDHVTPEGLVNHGKPTNGGEWKEGFGELYTFFKDVMAKVGEIVTREAAQDLWNSLLQKRNMALISKLGKEVSA